MRRARMLVPGPARQRLAGLGAVAWRHALLAPIVALAAWLRLANLGAEHLYGDQAEYAIVARHLSHDWAALLYPALADAPDRVFVSQPPLVLYLMAGSMRLLGATDVAAILPTALLGIATVPVVYALGHRLGGRLPAVVGALLLAVLPFHVSMSRQAMLDVGYAFFLVLGAYFLVAWLQERRLRHALAAGAAAACAGLSKLPGALAVAVVAAVLLLALAPPLLRRLARRGRGDDADGLRRTAGHALLALAPAALAALAYVALLARLGALDDLHDKLAWNLGRIQGSGAGTSQHGLAYYFRDPYSSFQAQLGAGTFALALAGLGFALGRAVFTPTRALAHAVVPAATLALAAFFLLSGRKVGFYLLPFAPLAALLVAGLASGVRDLAEWAGIRFSRREVRWAAPVATALALAVVATPAYAAFEESYDSYGVGRDGSTFGYGLREAAAWVHDRDPEAAQYGTLLGRFTLRWYNDQPTHHAFVGEAALDAAARHGNLRYVVVDHYVVLPEDKAFMRRLVAWHDGELVAEFERGWGRVEVYELHP